MIQLFNSLSWTPASTGATIRDRLVSAASGDNTAPAVDQPVPHDEDKSQDDAGFEGCLNGLVAICATPPTITTGPPQPELQVVTSDSSATALAITTAFAGTSAPTLVPAEGGGDVAIDPASSQSNLKSQIAPPTDLIRPDEGFTRLLVADKSATDGTDDLTSLTPQPSDDTAVATPVTEPVSIESQVTTLPSQASQPDQPTQLYGLLAREDNSIIELTDGAPPETQVEPAQSLEAAATPDGEQGGSTNNIPATAQQSIAVQQRNSPVNVDSPSQSAGGSPRVDGTTLESNRLALQLGTQTPVDRSGPSDVRIESVENGKKATSTDRYVTRAKGAEAEASQQTGEPAMEGELSTDSVVDGWRGSMSAIMQSGHEPHRSFTAGNVAGEARPQHSDQDGGMTTGTPQLATSAVIDSAAMERTISADARTPGTLAEQIHSQITGRVELTQRNGTTDFRMQLDPPGLGTVHVHLTASDHSITARLVVNDEAARQAIEGQLHTLRESLANAGVSLGKFDVTRHNGGSQSTWQWQRPEGGPVSPTFRVQGPARRSVVMNSRPRAGRIDVLA